jgi:hypothetical protein
MAGSKFQEELDAFRRAEQPEAVLLVAGNTEYVSIAAAWTDTSIRRRRRPGGPPGVSDAARWNWLWENVSFSGESLRKRSGVPGSRFQDRLDTLIASRALYPDGTLNSFVRRYLRERVLRLLGVGAEARRAMRPAAGAPGGGAQERVRRRARPAAARQPRAR